MLFTIEHTTEYRFTRPVFFEPHQLRFQPRNDGSQRLVRFDLQIDPTPAGTTQSLDADGNLVTMAWFEDVHERMTIRTTSEVETLRENPFDYLLTPANSRLPIGYQPWEQAQLAVACRRVDMPQHCDPARELAEQVREARAAELVPFLTRLSTTICERFKLVHRDKGCAMAAGDDDRATTRCVPRSWPCCSSTFAAARPGRPICQRLPGSVPQQGKRYLHAWAEVYLPVPAGAATIPRTAWRWPIGTWPWRRRPIRSRRRR